MKSMGFNKGVGSSASEYEVSKNIGKRDRLREIWNLVVQEARGVSLWSLLSIFLRIVLVFLGMMDTHHEYFSRRLESVVGLKEVAIATSKLARWILHLTPSKVSSMQAPGFIFANPWLLLWVKDKTGVIPNLSTRACEYVMGRISLLELGGILPIHIVTVVSTSVFLRRILPASIVQMAFEPIEYADGENSWVVDFSREVIASSAFTVTLLVLPALLQLNYMPRWILGFAMYPLLNFSVDGPGMASTFSPNTVLALSVMGHRPLPSLWRLLGPLLGGLIGGRVMKLYFPDRERVAKGTSSY